MDETNEIANSFLIVLKYIQAQRPNNTAKSETSRVIFDFLTILQKYYLLANSSGICEMCSDRGRAVGFCKNCNLLVDHQCIKYHEKILLLKHHEVTDFTRRGREMTLLDVVPKIACRLTNHYQLELRSYCTTCKILVCQICSQEHNLHNHTVNKVEDFIILLSYVIDAKCIMESIIKRLPRIEDNRGIFETLYLLDVLINNVIGGKKYVSGSVLLRDVVKLMVENPRETLPTIQETTGVMEIVTSKLKAIFQTLGGPLQGIDPMSALPHPDGLIQFNAGNSAEGLEPIFSQTNMSDNDNIERTDSIGSDDLFQSPEEHVKPEGDAGAEKTPEQELKALQYDIENVFNLESFENIHPQR